MSDFICTKGLTLGGVDYTPGQTIPAGAVLPSRVRALARQATSHRWMIRQRARVSPLRSR